MEQNTDSAVEQCRTSLKNEKKKNAKIRKRDTKSTENVLKCLEELDGVEKYDALVIKYNDLYNSYRTTSSEHTVLSKQISTLQRDKETLQVEQNRLILARTRLEVLCRELQKQNKTVKDQCITKIRDEEERRKTMTAKFQETLAEVTNTVQENTEKNLKIRDENLNMVQKIRDLYNEFEARKQQAAHLEQQMDLERKLYKAELEKLRLEYESERESWEDERKIFQETISRGEKFSAQLQAQIDKLQRNLEDYTSKYTDFEDHVSKSNQVFDNCKSELTGMAKRIEVLNKDSKLWKQRFENNSHTIVDLKKMKAALESKLDRSDRQLISLQKLCHQLQLERSSYMRQLEGSGIKPRIILKPKSSDSDQVIRQKESELEALKAQTTDVMDPHELAKNQELLNADVSSIYFIGDSTDSIEDYDDPKSRALGYARYREFVKAQNKEYKLEKQLRKAAARATTSAKVTLEE